MTRQAAKQKEPELSSTLAAYFHDLSHDSLLSGEEERRATQRIEELEVLAWQKMLSYPRAVPAVLELVEEALAHPDTPLVCPEGSRKDWEADACALRLASASAGKAIDEVARARLNKTARKVAEHLRSFDVERQVPEQIVARLVTELVQGKRRQGAKLSAYLQEIDQALQDAAAAREAFIRANLRLVVAIARKYRRDLLPLPDLIQEGNIGLMKGLTRFDYRRGVKFSTYASWWIRHSINRALAEKGREVRIPVHMLDTQHRIAKAERELHQRLGRETTLAELSAASHISGERIQRMRTYLRDRPLSLDATPGKGGQQDERTLHDMLSDPNQEQTSVLDELGEQELLRKLPGLLPQVLEPMEADILRWRFGFADDHELTLKEIGEKYGLSRERIRQLQEQALDKVRRALRRRHLI